VVKPIKLEMGVNLKTAKALGLTVPPDILALVDKGHRIGRLLRCTWQKAALRDEADPLRRINFTSAFGGLRKTA
jgi:hypothetical protein